MFGKFVGKLTYANVMATVAVFVAIGGGAYAAGIAKNSVGSKQIKDGQVKSVDVKDNSLTGADINESQLTLPPGPKGDKGEPGPKGDPGANGATEVTRRLSGLWTVAADGATDGVVNCEPGEVAVGGGGVAWDGITADFNMISSAPLLSDGSNFVDEGVPVGWRTSYFNLDSDNNGSGDIKFRTYVNCAAP